MGLLVADFQFIRNRKKERFIAAGKFLPLIAGTSALFLMVLAVVYYSRGEAVMGYSEVYSEYSGILGPLGTVLFLYALTVGYFRFIKRKKKEHPS